MQKFLLFSRMATLIIAVGWINIVVADDIKCPVSRVILTNQFSVLEDPARSLTVDQVIKPNFAAQFKPNTKAQTNFGMSNSAFWFRIEPTMAPECALDWLLAIRWALIDNIEFYWHENDTWQRNITGAKHPYASRQINFQTYIFRFPNLSLGHPPYFVRVSGDNPLFMGMRMLHQKRFDRNAPRRLLVQGIYLGILLGLILYNLFVFLSLRDSAYLYYVLYLISTTLLVAQYSGIATRYLWPTTPAWNILAFWTFILTGTLAYLAYIRKFLKSQQITPKIDKVIHYFGAVLLIALLGLFVLNHALMITTIPILALVGFSLSGIAIFNAIKNGYRPAQYIGLANIIFISGMIWASLLMFGYPTRLFEWNYFIFVFGILIEAILLSLALASRIKLLHQEKLSAQQDLLNNRKHFSERLIATQDTQRKRIASELHDGIGQNLMVVNNRLNRILSTDLPKDLSKQLDFASSITQQTIHDLRGLSHLLHPHQLDRLGLAIAIETMANETLSDTNIKLTCQTDDIDHLVNKDQSLHLYRIVQEAVNNIVRHAKADQVSISIGGEKQGVYLNISDNGQGILASWFDQKDYSQAFGLSSIQERVHLMSGAFDMVNAMPHGITLTIKIPLKQV